MQSSSGGSSGGNRAAVRGGAAATTTRTRLQDRLKGDAAQEPAAHWSANTSQSQKLRNGKAKQEAKVSLSAMPNGRMPQAPASLLVQLPPNELQRMLAEQQKAQGCSSVTASHSPAMSSMALQNQAAAAAARLGLGSNNNGGPSQPVGMSDVALLAASLQERREREAKTFIWQQRLIGGVSVDRTMLKRALTQLSLPAWLQVLQERHLAHRCAYPVCLRAPKRTHSSYDRQSVLPSGAPRFRISLSRRVIERDERDDAGGENAFCSRACWRRGEWVSRWVLNGGQSTRQVQHAVSDGDEGFLASSAASNGQVGSYADGGRWDRIMDESLWTEIELLEDLEDRGEVDRLNESEEDATQHLRRSSGRAITSLNGSLPPIVMETEVSEKLSPSDNFEEALLDGMESMQSDTQIHHDVLKGEPTRLARERVQQRAAQANAGTAESFLDLLNSLEIRERQGGQAPGHTAQRSELSALEEGQSSELQQGTGLFKANTDVDMSTGEEASDDERQFSENDAGRKRHQLRANHEGKPEPEQRDEDDLFAQAWEALDFEKSQGRWEE